MRKVCNTIPSLSTSIQCLESSLSVEISLYVDINIRFKELRKTSLMIILAMETDSLRLI